MHVSKTACNWSGIAPPPGLPAAVSALRRITGGCICASGSVRDYHLHSQSSSRESIEIDVPVRPKMSQTQTHTESLDERDPDHKTAKPKSRRPASEHYPELSFCSAANASWTWLISFVNSRHCISPAAVESVAVSALNPLSRLKVVEETKSRGLNNIMQTDSYSQDRATSLLRRWHHIRAYRRPATVRQFAGQSSRSQDSLSSNYS